MIFTIISFKNRLKIPKKKNIELFFLNKYSSLLCINLIIKNKRKTFRWIRKDGQKRSHWFVAKKIRINKKKIHRGKFFIIV